MKVDFLLNSVTVCFLLSGLLGLKAIERKSPSRDIVKASMDPRGQIIIEENGEKVLQYNYQTVYEEDLIRTGNVNKQKIVYSDTMSGIYFEEYLKCHPEFPKDTIVTSAIYAIPRSDYIHPLYGLDGAMLTNDWPDFNGIFEGSKSTSGLMVLQHRDNPEYPGDWVEYPDLAWVDRFNSASEK